MDRVKILQRTLDLWNENNNIYTLYANSNMNKWMNKRTEFKQIKVVEGDWGEVTLRATKQYGQTFTVLNMANAYYAGGGYLDGAMAQEENIFRRTDCHFSLFKGGLAPIILPLKNVLKETYSDQIKSINENGILYTEKYTRLINGEDDVVFLDLNKRTCFISKEITNDHFNSYKLMDPTEMFQFYEMRSAALNLKHVKFDKELTRKRIRAQINSLNKLNLKHVILGAWGCGAFRNSPLEIAKIYKEELQNFNGVAIFAIYYAGYGPKDNYDIFKSVLEN